MSMIACLRCKTVVWAYDHEPRSLAGVMNGMKMPCPKCGEVACFDGWNVWDEWQEMRNAAAREGLAWEPDGECRWFGEKTTGISAMLKGEAVPIFAPLADDRYDAAHPEEERDGGLGSGDWMEERTS